MQIKEELYLDLHWNLKIFLCDNWKFCDLSADSTKYSSKRDRVITNKLKKYSIFS